jgi:hypothetical protein
MMLPILKTDLPCPSEDLPPIFGAELIWTPARGSTLPNSVECSQCLTGTEILETKFMFTVVYKKAYLHPFTDIFLTFFIQYRQKMTMETLFIPNSLQAI